jgi:hypothetical protein
VTVSLKSFGLRFLRQLSQFPGCDLNNAQSGYSLPIHCILCDGVAFEFFKFQRKPEPSFLRGCFPGDPPHLRRGLKLRDFTETTTSLPFLLDLLCVSETIFDTMLCAYISGLKAYHERSKPKGEKQGHTRPSFDGWDKAQKSAQDALDMLRNADMQRQDGDVDLADKTIEEALALLKERYYIISLTLI